MHGLAIVLWLALSFAGYDGQASGRGVADALQIPGGLEESAIYIAAPDGGDLQKGDAAVSGHADVAERLSGMQLNRQRGEMMKQLSLPVVVLLVGGLIYTFVPRAKVLAQVVLFFGAQTFMNLYMKLVLSRTLVSTDLHLRGFQAPFMLTAMQQLVGFVFLMLLIGLSHVAGFPYTPRKLRSGTEVRMVLALSLAFTCNIALNNWSLSMLDLTANVMIRSMSPFTALILQVIFKRWLLEVDIRPGKMLLLLGGILATFLVVVSGTRSGHNAGHSHYLLGMIVCMSSLFFSNAELLIVKILGNGEFAELNAVDTLLYMAIPVALLLLGPIFLLPHPLSYAGQMASTDWRVFMQVCSINPLTVILVMLSGIWAVCYNLLLYTLVHDLSPVFATAAGGFNKAAAVGLALLLHLEHLPVAPWGGLMVLGVLGNVASFAAFALYPRSLGRAPLAAKAFVHAPSKTGGSNGA